jgi:protein ImuB
MQLDLGAHPPAAPVTKVYLDAAPVKPRVAQGGLFVPAAPEPERLELTLARVAALVGEENVGSPELLDTHRPDAFRMQRFVSALPIPSRDREGAATLAFRFYRPPLSARVQVEQGRPVFLLAGSIRGHIVSASGPWRTSGDWWTTGPWDRDEWDVGLREGALYRIYCAYPADRWFVEGSFD